MRDRSWRIHAAVLAAYIAAALLFSWPLPRHVDSHLTGTPGGDTGVYVWNQWVFRHELIEHGRFPLFTDAILASAGGANLGLHNYTIFQNLLALPLGPWLGTVATFNVIYLAMIVLTAYVTFLLARHVTGRAPEAWLAGLLFAWSPLLVARGTAHFSLVAAAPLPLFVLVLLRIAHRDTLAGAAVGGAVIAWAATTDVYYAVYCLLLWALFLAGSALAVERVPDRGSAVLRRSIDVLLLAVGALVLAVAIGGGWELSLLGQEIRVRSLYTPVLVLTVLALFRIGTRFRVSLAAPFRAEAWRAVRQVATAGIVATVLLSPVLYAALLRLASPGFEPPRIFWRSSPAGADLLALILPNPNHPLAPQAFADWIASRPGGYAENVVSIPLVALAVMAVAWTRGWRPSWWWTGMAAGFGLLALGPFVHLAGVNTYVPGPWAILRYVPIAGLARTPTRFSIVLMLAVAVLFAAALAWLGRRHPERRTAALLTAGLLLAFELMPAPLTLYAARVPTVYEHVAAAPADTRLLEIPFGLRDGTNSMGDFTARSQFFQTAHGKSLIGGYLSRLAWGRLSELYAHPVLSALVRLSEGQPLPPETAAQAIAHAPGFAATERIAYVVVDRSRASAELISFVIRAFRLERVASDGTLDLYRPRPGYSG